MAESQMVCDVLGTVYNDPLLTSFSGHCDLVKHEQKCGLDAKLALNVIL